MIITYDGKAFGRIDTDEPINDVVAAFDDDAVDTVPDDEWEPPGRADPLSVFASVRDSVPDDVVDTYESDF